ncbi:MAG: small multi-drug export protein [Clostridiales bacterium]|nr:small multi-drug export protein [Clostridiales bacterium]
MDAFIESIGNAMNNALGAPLAVILLSIIPIAEARFAIPFGMSAGMGLSPLEAFGYAFLGSSLIAPILLIVFIPIINALSRTKVFAKIGKFLYDKFEKKSRSLKDAEQPESEQIANGEASTRKKLKITKSDVKKMSGVALFVAVPLPLTGVWTGSAVASILKIGFVKSLIGVIFGNAVACGIITLITYLFKDYVSWITLAFFIIAVLVVLFLIIKLIIYKPSEAQDGASAENDKPDSSL